MIGLGHLYTYKQDDPQSKAEFIAAQARTLVEEAEKLGVSLRIDRAPLQPLAMGHARHVVEAWPARHQPAPPPAPDSRLAGTRGMSDREWAAMPANLREGCTTHVPGVGDL